MLGKLLDRFREKGPSRPRSKAETEKRRRLLIVLLIVVAVVSSVSIVGYGYYDTSVRPWNERILKVNGTVLDMRAFVYALRLQQSYSQYYSSQAEWAQGVASGLEQNELTRQYLESEFGITIGDGAIEAELRDQLTENFVSQGIISDNAAESEYKKAYKDWRSAVHKNGLSEKSIEELVILPQLVQEELQKQIGDRDYPSTGNFDHAQVQALLVTGADEAALLRARWEAGEAFDTLILEKAVSTSLRDFAADNATMVQWVAKGIKSTAFDEFVFSAALDMLSDPIQDTDSTGSYWLIRVVARESRTLSDSDRETLVGEAYSEWLEEISDPEKNDIVNYLDKKGGTAKLNWALAQVAV